MKLQPKYIWQDIRIAPWPDKIFMVIDLILNPHATDWPIATDFLYNKTYMVRWISKNGQKKIS